MHNLNVTNEQRFFWLIQFLYFSLCFVILFKLPPELPFVAGADASSWIMPAKALLKHHDFVFLENPNLADVYRPPVVPLFNALFLWIGQEHGIKAIILAQVVLLSSTSIIVARIAESIQQGTGTAAMTILLFNPNSLSSALLIQSETLFCFLLICSVYNLIQYVHSKYWRHILSCGIFLALASLARPTTQYLIALLPIISFTLLLFHYGWSHFKPHGFIQGTVASVMATLIIIPWALKVGQTEGQLSLTTTEIRSIYIFDQLHYLESYRSDMSISEVNEQLSKSESQQLRLNCNQMPHASPERLACFQTIIKIDSNKLFGLPFGDYVQPFLRSMGGFLFSGGSGNWHNLLFNNTQQTVYKSWLNIKQGEPASLLSQILSTFNPAAMLITAMCLVFSAAVKLFSLFGIFYLIKRKRLATLCVLLGLMGYFAATTLFLGQSRYRVPIEPYFAILCVSGWVEFRHLLFAKRQKGIET